MNHKNRKWLPALGLAITLSGNTMAQDSRNHQHHGHHRGVKSRDYHAGQHDAESVSHHECG